MQRYVTSLLAIAGTLLVARAEEPGKSDPKVGEGWIDLMKPEVWKKFDPAWKFPNVKAKSKEQLANNS